MIYSYLYKQEKQIVFWHFYKRGFMKNYMFCLFMLVGFNSYLYSMERTESQDEKYQQLENAVDYGDLIQVIRILRSGICSKLITEHYEPLAIKALKLGYFKIARELVLHGAYYWTNKKDVNAIANLFPEPLLNALARLDIGTSCKQYLSSIIKKGKFIT